MIDYTTAQTQNPTCQGLYVAAVAYGSDFEVGDRIVAVDGTVVTSCGHMREVMATCRAGDVISVTVMREDGPVGVDVTLTAADVGEGNSTPAA